MRSWVKISGKRDTDEWLPAVFGLWGFKLGAKGEAARRLPGKTTSVPKVSFAVYGHSNAVRIAMGAFPHFSVRQSQYFGQISYEGVRYQ
jgi:hypothetical protein